MAKVRRWSDFILYSSLWVSACAGSLVIYTYDLTGHDAFPDAYTGFVMSSTIVLYSAHRLMGIPRVIQFVHLSRFSVVDTRKWQIAVIGTLSLAATFYFLWKLDHRIYLWLFIPVVLSALYVVPLFGRRLRDLPLIKIFVVSLVWASLTGLIPYFVAGNADPTGALILLCERAAFIFAITIPFDIRDTFVDKASDLRTLPHLLGVRGAKQLAIVVYFLSAILCAVLMFRGTYPDDLLLPYAASWVITVLLIAGAQPEMDDHYFSGLLDGTMFLLPFLYWIWTCI